MAIELAKLLRWTVRDVGREHLPSVIQLTVETYGNDNSILTSLVETVCGRPLQPIHRYKDYRKKAKMPNEVTKYDIADGLSSVLYR